MDAWLQESCSYSFRCGRGWRVSSWSQWIPSAGRGRRWWGYQGMGRKERREGEGRKDPRKPRGLTWSMFKLFMMALKLVGNFTYYYGNVLCTVHCNYIHVCVCVCVQLQQWCPVVPWLFNKWRCVSPCSQWQSLRLVTEMGSVVLNLIYWKVHCYAS